MAQKKNNKKMVESSKAVFAVICTAATVAMGTMKLISNANADVDDRSYHVKENENLTKIETTVPITTMASTTTVPTKAKATTMASTATVPTKSKTTTMSSTTTVTTTLTPITTVMTTAIETYEHSIANEQAIDDYSIDNEQVIDDCDDANEQSIDDCDNANEETIDNYSDDVSEEKIILCNVVAHEYGSDYVSEYDKGLIVEVVMNRVESSHFPNSIIEVLTQPGQFDGANEYVYMETYSSEVTASVINAVDYYFSNRDKYCHGFLYFWGDGQYNYFY